MNHHKTYVAFDAINMRDALHSNLPFLNQIIRWQAQYPDRLHLINFEEIRYSSQHDDWIDGTVKNHFLKLMAQADNLLVLASDVMDVESPILNWQISRAVNRFKLPVIVAYVGLEKLDEKDIRTYWNRLPNKVRKYIGRDSAPIVHIPLTKDKLERALSTFSRTEGNFPWDSTTIF